MIFHISQIHFTYAIQQLYKFFITLCNGRTQFIAVYIIVIKQSGKVALCLTAFRLSLIHILQISKTYNISKGLDGIQNTVGTGKCLYQPVHFQILVYPQRIHGCSIKPCKKHIYYDQNIQFSILHAKRYIFIVILKFIT